MDNLRIVTLGGEILRQKAMPVTEFDAKLAKTVERMIELMHAADGVGLAAPQVGIARRFFVAHVKQETPLVFINPSIIETSVETTVYEEGCLSLAGVYADVTRSIKIRAQAFDVKGRPFNIECGGILARIIQHEYDHLEGVLFFDYLSEVKQKRLIDKYERIRKKQVRPEQRKRPLKEPEREAGGGGRR